MNLRNANIAKLLTEEITRAAQSEGTWGDEYRSRVEAVSEAAAAVAADSLINGEASDLTDLLVARVRNLEAAGLVHAARYVRSGIESVFRVALRAALLVL